MIISNRYSFACKVSQRNSIKEMFDEQHYTSATAAKFLFDNKEFLKVLGRKGGF